MTALTIVALASCFVQDLGAGTLTGTFSRVVVEKMH